MLNRSNVFPLLARCCLIFFLIFSVKSYAIDLNKNCSGDVNGQAIYSLGYTLDAVNITSSTPNGAVIGKIVSKFQNFTCHGLNHLPWVLQISPRGRTFSGNAYLCQTNIDGIGIEYLDSDGQLIACGHWGAILTMARNQDNASLREGTVLARLIKVTGTLPKGSYSLDIGATLLAYMNGDTTSTEWGPLVLRGSNIIYTTPYTPQIYFPTSPTSTPIIDLNIDNNFHGIKASSTPRSQNLDMCLFDGDNSSSNSITLTFSDDAAGITGKAPEKFSIFRNGGSRSDIKDRLDYLVSVLNPVTGSQEQVKNGVAAYWSFGSSTKKRIRQVVLPGVGLALCIPAPITISTPSLDISGKSSGNYTGVLRVTYTPSTYAAASE